MVDYSSIRADFNNENEIIKYRKILETVLLDERFSECFGAVQKYLCAINEVDYQLGKKNIVDEANLEFTEYKLTFITGDDAFDIDDDVFFDLHTTVGLSRCKDLGTNDVALHRDFNQGSTETINVKTDSPLKWRQIQRFQITVQSTGDESWFLKRFSVEGKDTTNKYHTLFSDDINVELEDDGANPYVIRDTIKPIVAETKQNPLDKLSEEERCCVNKLKKHLVGNSNYYNRAIWLLEDPNDRASHFEGIAVNGKSLLDWIENRPLDVLGNYVVFPADPAIGGLIEEPEKVKVEKLMTLPTRGVFGEAKLGHCNASEVIDNTRFWDWQTSPIPEQAPEIKEVSTDSRNVTQNLTPTALPSSIVNIVNPSNLPDPTGMAGALNLLGKSDLFRDMSMGKEVNDLLKQLSSDAVKYGELALKARQVLDKQNTSTANSGGGSNQPTGAVAGGAAGASAGNESIAVSNDPKVPASKAQDAIMLSELQASKGAISQADHKENVKGILKNTAGTPSAAQGGPATKDKIFVFQAIDFKGNTISDFPMQATVFDILHSKTVLNKSSFTGYGQTLIKFDDATPTIKIVLETNPITIKSEFFTLVIPKINKQTIDPLLLKNNQKLLTVTLKQGFISAKVAEKTKEEAAKTLADEYGVKLGFDKVVAAELLAKASSQTVTTKGNESAIEYTVMLPDNSYELIIK
jgi:hypothetical protein